MLDMLVLSRAARFTGFHASSFSWYVQEHRCQRGIPVTTTTMPKVSVPCSAAHQPCTVKLTAAQPCNSDARPARCSALERCRNSGPESRQRGTGLCPSVGRGIVLRAGVAGSLAQRCSVSARSSWPCSQQTAASPGTSLWPWLVVLLMHVAFAVLQESEMGSEAFLPNTLKLNNYTAVCPG